MVIEHSVQLRKCIRQLRQISVSKERDARITSASVQHDELRDAPNDRHNN